MDKLQQLKELARDTFRKHQDAEPDSFDKVMLDKIVTSTYLQAEISVLEKIQSVLSKEDPVVVSGYIELTLQSLKQTND